jgi:hypothetical protein
MFVGMHRVVMTEDETQHQQNSTRDHKFCQIIRMHPRHVDNDNADSQHFDVHENKN